MNKKYKERRKWSSSSAVNI